MEIQTLRGVFPRPKMPPARNFIQENKKKLKELQEKMKTSKSNTDLPRSASLRRKPENLLQQQPSVSSAKPTKSMSAASSYKSLAVKSTSTNSVQSAGHGSIRSTESASTSSMSTRHDATSQTTDPNDSLFLKDVIIRMPSASILKQLNSNPSESDVNSNGLEPDTQNHFTDQINNVSAIKKQDLIEDPFNDHDIRISKHIDQLNEFTQNNFVRKRKNAYPSVECRNLVEECLRRRSFLNLLQQPQENIPTSNTSTMVQSESCPDVSTIRQKNCDSNPATAFKEDKRPRKLKDVPESYRLGEIPKYLKEIKQEKEEKERQAELVDPHCPSGHVALTDEERLDSLEMAKNKFEKVLGELNRLPLTIRSRRASQRKCELETELDRLEENIRIFSRSKVYVKIDQ